MTSERTTPSAAVDRVGECVLATVVALGLAVCFGLASAWLVVPIVVTVVRGRRLDELAVEPRLTPPSILAHLALGAMLLCLYGAAHVLVARSFTGAELVPRLPPNLGSLVLHQLLVVAIPEEVFFRGYLQANLARAWPRPRWRFAGAEFGPALLVQAVVFAACHLLTGDWLRARVGAFGLLAGWLRARSGSVAAPVVYHAVANVWVAILEASLRQPG